MKKISFSIIAFFFVFLLNAQQEEIYDTKYFIGGHINFNTSDNMLYYFSSLSDIDYISAFEIENRNYGFSLSFGKEINEKLSIGFNFLSYSNKSNHDGLLPDGNSGSEFTNNGYKFGIFSRYKLNPADKLSVFLSPYFAYGLSNEKNTFINRTSESDINSFNTGVSFGALYHLSDKFNAVVNLGGINYITGTKKSKNEKDLNFNSFGMAINLNTLYLGLEYNF